MLHVERGSVPLVQDDSLIQVSRVDASRQRGGGGYIDSPAGVRNVR